MFLYLLLCLLPYTLGAVLYVGIGTSDITPPTGTPSAGYQKRLGEPMTGIKDPLLATALFLDNEKQKVIICSVDHLGFTEEMVKKIIDKVKIPDCEVFIASTHTHSGGGAFLAIPGIGESLAGKYDPEIEAFYVQRTVNAIHEAYAHRERGLFGIGYGTANDLSIFRSSYPEHTTALQDVTVFKILAEDGKPLGIMVNYPMHPTILTHENRFFSADFIGSLRVHVEDLGKLIYVNGAQAEIIPASGYCCDTMGLELAHTVKKIWDATTVSNTVSIQTKKAPYSFCPKPNPFGVNIPLTLYHSEMNILVLNKKEAFLTIPGELSVIYDRELKEEGKRLGFDHVSIWGLVNGAHGYIILPEAWRRKTFESRLSFGGEAYGAEVKERAIDLLESVSILYNDHKL